MVRRRNTLDRFHHRALAKDHARRRIFDTSLGSIASSRDCAVISRIYINYIESGTPNACTIHTTRVMSDVETRPSAAHETGANNARAQCNGSFGRPKAHPAVMPPVGFALYCRYGPELLGSRSNCWAGRGGFVMAVRSSAARPSPTTTGAVWPLKALAMPRMTTGRVSTYVPATITAPVAAQSRLSDVCDDPTKSAGLCAASTAHRPFTGNTT